MKLRKNFVSNSSSTSFIVQEKDYDKYKNKLDLYKIKDLYKKYQEIEKEIKDLKDMLPYFIVDDGFYLKNVLPYSNEIEEVYKKHPEAYISDSYDRDMAWTNGIAGKLESFETDL